MINEQVRSPEFDKWLNTLPEETTGRVVRWMCRAKYADNGDKLGSNIRGYSLNTVDPKLYFLYKVENGKITYLNGRRLADKNSLFKIAKHLIRLRGL